MITPQRKQLLYSMAPGSCSHVQLPDYSLPPLQRFQFMEVPGNHYTHMTNPQHVAEVVTAFLQGRG